MNLNERELDAMMDVLLADAELHAAKCDRCGGDTDARHDLILNPGDDALGIPDALVCLTCVVEGEV